MREHFDMYAAHWSYCMPRTGTTSRFLREREGTATEGIPQMNLCTMTISARFQVSFIAAHCLHSGEPVGRPVLGGLTRHPHATMEKIELQQCLWLLVWLLVLLCVVSQASATHPPQLFTPLYQLLGFRRADSARLSAFRVLPNDRG